MSFLSQDDAGQLQEVVEIIVDVVAPAILKCIDAARPRVSEMQGELVSGELQAFEPVRDYRKELWINYAVGLSIENVLTAGEAAATADQLLAAFDERFPR